ncbi:ABC transporter [Croceibacterium mercuriale]|uniref:ABC transporter n=1 Tax=Croceibacterium mercuriale TaxID=1572751 RepID=A0A0B2C2W9_9SPHN|nr:ATP-binding cassette domain-containing protein [Croceibacterium mercuriale]KHL26520.1 ABC transporter [Croceibacterium mercuriale]
MTSFLTLSHITAATPDGYRLFGGLSLAIGAERVGLVGRNGSGKSTLLRIAAGLAEPLQGTVARVGTSGTLAQHWPEEHFVARALGVEEEIARIDRIVAGGGSPADFASADWNLMPRIEQALAEVALPDLPLDRSIGTLSGGERTRVGLARLTLEQPDMLLLDEPTNNLDLAGCAAVHQFVAQWRGGVLIASHDRALLEGMDRIVELTPVGVHIVTGGWSAFTAQREAERMQATAELDRSAAALRATERAAQAAREAKDRRDKAGRAFAASGSEPRILSGMKAERAQNSAGHARTITARLVDEAGNRLQDARVRVEVLTPLTISLLTSGVPSTADVLTLDAVEVNVGQRRLGPWTLAIRGPERIALVGSNGSGKTTLLKVAAGQLVPDRGTVRRADGRIAMVDQHAGPLDPADTVLDNLRTQNPAMSDEAAHAACARFAFRNRDADRIVGTLSGGERLRAAMAVVMAGAHAPWLLILDEPTNHLDIASIEVLEHALREFDGALLVVSHDQRFLQAIGVHRCFEPGRADNAARN